MFRHRGTRTPRRLRTAQVGDALFLHGTSASTPAHEQQRLVRALECRPCLTLAQRRCFSSSTPSLRHRGMAILLPRRGVRISRAAVATLSAGSSSFHEDVAPHACSVITQSLDRACGHAGGRAGNRARQPHGGVRQKAQSAAVGIRPGLRRRRHGVRVAHRDPQQVDRRVFPGLQRQARLYLRHTDLSGRHAADHGDRPPGAKSAPEFVQRRSAVSRRQPGLYPPGWPDDRRRDHRAQFPGRTGDFLRHA